jgi:NAD(P)-dependent dehydrogenase (short-subunit alcohol dehydrogenase family)
MPRDASDVCTVDIEAPYVNTVDMGATMKPLVILVTGTSRGLGAALRTGLIENGHIVVGSSRSGSNDDLKLDVTDEASANAAVDAVVARHGRLDVLVNNAGSHLHGAAIETTSAELRAQMELNFFGAVHMMRAAIEPLIRTGGRIVNISSVGGIAATPFTSAYAASKFALEGYSEALSFELAPLGVSVTNVVPGFIQTGTHDESIVSVATDDARYADARKNAHEHMIAGSAKGLRTSDVVRAVQKVLAQKHPPLRVSVDGLAPRLRLLQALLPTRLYRALVMRATAPLLADRRLATRA